MTLDTTTNHYVLENIDLNNNIGYDLLERATIIGNGNPSKKVNWFLKTLSKVVYQAIESRQEGEYLKSKFNEDLDFVMDTLITQFLFWEDTDVDIMQSYTKGLSPLVERDLRDKGFMFNGKIMR